MYTNINAERERDHREKQEKEIKLREIKEVIESKAMDGLKIWKIKEILTRDK